MSTTERLQAPVAVPAYDPARPPLVSVVIPCLNESETIAECVTRARHALHSSDLHGEAIVADNGSRERPPGRAAEAGPRLLREPRRGYGSAYLAGFGAARGEYVVMADADLTYDFGDIPRFVEQLEARAPLATA